MAYSENNLTQQWMPQIRVPNANTLTLEVLQEAIQNQADENGISVAFRDDELKTGGLFSKEREPVLIMFNPEKTGYLTFLLRVKHQGKYAFVDVFTVGGSRNYANENVAADGSTMRKITNLISGHSSKLQEEENYYAILRDCLENLFS